MSISKDLVVIGGYPSNEHRTNILKNTILNLNSHFDILLVTHYPADVELQKLVNYYIYDDKNEHFENETVHFWGDYPKFYFEYYYGENGQKHHSYAIYRSMLNAASFARNYYDGFYYIEGDSLFSENDIQKIKDIKAITSSYNKNGFFFVSDDSKSKSIQTMFFYVKTSFFDDVFPVCTTANEYIETYNKLNTFGMLEWFFYSILETNNTLGKVYLQYQDCSDYFNTSKINLNFIKEHNNSSIPFEIKIVKIKNTYDLAYLCVSNPHVDFSNSFDLYINDEFITKLPGSELYSSGRISPKSEKFEVRLNDIVIGTYTKDQILKSQSFVEFK